MGNKPKAKLINKDGNIFNLAGIVSGVLNKNGMKNEAKEFQSKLWNCQSYDEALNLMSEYVDIY